MQVLFFYHLPDFLIVVVSTWLGLGLLVKAPHNRIIRAFAVFSIHLALYGITAIQYHLTSSQEVALILGRAELVAIVLTPAAFLYFIAVLTAPMMKMKPLSVILVAFFYITGVLLAFYAIFGQLQPPIPHVQPWTSWEEPRFPSGLLEWASAGQRVIPLFIALLLMWNAYWRNPVSVYDLRLRNILMFTAILGVIGAVTATIAREFSQSPAIPRTLIVLAMLIFTYTVLTKQGLLGARATRRAFLYSVIGSLFTMAYVGVVMLMEWVAGEILKINIPLVSALSIVGLAAAFGPVGEWVRGQFDRHFYPRAFDYSRLLKTLSDELFDRGDLREQLQTALTSICHALNVHTGAVAVLSPEGLFIRAIYGIEPIPSSLQNIPIPEEPQILEEPWEQLPFAYMVYPLRRGDEQVGLLILGQRDADYTEEQTFSASEQALLDHLSSYLALTIDHANARDVHRAVTVKLNEQVKLLRQHQEDLERQVAETAERVIQEDQKPTYPKGLTVYALGALRVEREGQPVTRWGGDKAGTYQAEAVFAFLFDRRGKGVTKDEVEEMIWPDLEIAKADTAFHRTLAGLRRTLEPGLHRGNQSRSILYHHDRYWLDPATIAWSDTEEFLKHTEQGITQFHQHDYDGALISLEAAYQLYRGDYMDDCPFFGDSSYVEDQRQMLRSRYIDILLALGAIYESRGRAGEAITVYRRVLALNFNECPPASEGLARLQENLTA